MTIVNRLLAEARDNMTFPPRPLTDRTLIDMMGGPSTHTGIAVSEQSAVGRFVSVYRAVSLVAGGIAALPFVAFRDGPGREPFLSQLIASPHPDMPPLEFWETVIAHMLLWGNAFSLKVRGTYDTVTELWPLPPDRVTVKRVSVGRANPQGKEFGYRDDRGQVKWVTPRDVLHMPGPGYDGLVGLSPIGVARQAVSMGLAAEEYGARLFGQGSLMQGFLQTDQKLTLDQATAIKRAWQDKVTGLSKAHDVAILDSGATWQSVTIPPVDAQFIEFRKMQKREIATLYGIPPYLLGEVETSSSWGCLPGDSMVFTKQGPRPINEVAVGTKLWSLEEGRGLVEGEVTAWRMTGVKPLLTIETSARTLRATENHRVPIRRYAGRSTASSGEVGWTDMWVRADQIALGDHLMIPHGLTPGTGTTAPNGRPLTPDVMSVCGLYLGDGSLDGNRVEIAHETEPDHMDHYRTAIIAEFGLQPYVTKRRTATRFSSKAAVELLETGFTGTALTKRVPGWVFGLVPELQLALLRGYLDADGSVQRGRIIYSSAHKALLEDIRHLCIGLGIPVGRVCLGRAAGAGTIRGRAFQAHAKYQLSLSSLSFNGRIGSHSPRKAARFVDTPTTRRLRYDEAWTGPGTTGKHPVGVGWAYPDMALQRVTKLSRSPLAVPVYDITVTGTASFVSDGVLVHNTGIEQQSLGFVAYTLRPWMSRVEQRFSRECLPLGVHAEFDTDDLLRGDATARATAAAVWVEHGIKMRSEVRAEEKLPPVPGTDNFLIGSKMALIDQNAPIDEAPIPIGMTPPHPPVPVTGK